MAGVTKRGRSSDLRRVGEMREERRTHTHSRLPQIKPPMANDREERAKLNQNGNRNKARSKIEEKGEKITANPP